MNVFELVGGSYNYYPNTAIELCVISYGDTSTIAPAVTANTDLSGVWGGMRVEHHWRAVQLDVRRGKGQHRRILRRHSRHRFFEPRYVAVAGLRCRHFAAAQHLAGQSKNLPSTALVSQGTFNGMSDLLDLTDPISGLSLVAFLTQAKPRNVFVTGHSLGGTLTPPMFAYLNATLYNGGTISNMALWSFAGLTPGGTGFNKYFNSIIPNNQGFLWRIQNSLDIAPLMWWSFKGVENIYGSKLPWSFLECGPITDLFNDASKANIGYAQPQPGLLLTGTFDHSIIDANLWAAQALHQHHSTTYQTLVNAKHR